MASYQDILTELRGMRGDIGEIKISFAQHCEQSIARDTAIKIIKDDLYGNGKPAIVSWARVQMKKMEEVADDTRKLALSWKSGILLFLCTIAISTFVGIVVDKVIK
jgi:hypothetical protein